MTTRKDIWFPEFLEFLGITDERVLLVCNNDHVIAVENNNREY